VHAAADPTNKFVSEPCLVGVRGLTGELQAKG